MRHRVFAFGCWLAVKHVSIPGKRNPRHVAAFLDNNVWDALHNKSTRNWDLVISRRPPDGVCSEQLGQTVGQQVGRLFSSLPHVDTAPHAQGLGHTVCEARSVSSFGAVGLHWQHPISSSAESDVSNANS